MTQGWLTTGEAARLLGVSRQHVVNLCERGDVPCSRVGAHRRIRRSDLEMVMTRGRSAGVDPVKGLTREQEKSLWLHRALLGHLMVDPHRVLTTARANLASWEPTHRVDGVTAGYLRDWARILADGADAVCEVLTGTDERSQELRTNSPFAGVLLESERRQALRAFREHWDRRHAA